MRRISELTQQNMTRREFLATLGFGLMALFGLGAITKLLGRDNPLKGSTSYGAGTYGGRQHGPS